MESGQAPLRRVRREGGGRKSLAVTDPELLAALLALVEPTRRGDPESPLCWTTLSTRKLAAELTAAGQKIGADTVAVLLREQGFSLQGNAKTMSLSRCLCKQVVDLVVGRRGSSALDGVPVLAAVKLGRHVRLRGRLTAAARRRDWHGWRNPPSEPARSG